MVVCLSVFIFSHVCEEGGPRGRAAFREEDWVLQFQAMDLLWSRCGQEDLSGVQRHLLQRTQGSGWTFGGERFPDSWCSLSYGRLLLFGCGFVSFVYFAGLFERDKAYNLETRMLAYRYVFVFLYWWLTMVV